MKIGVEAENLSSLIRGIGYYSLTLLESLKQQNITCFHTKNFIDDALLQISHFHFRKRLPLPFYNSLASLFHYRCYHDLDLLHFLEPKILYGKKPKIPFVLTIHDLMPLLFPHFFPKKSFLVMRYFLPRYLRDAKAIITVSHQTKKDLLTFFPKVEKKVHVIPCTLLPIKRTIQKEKKPFLFYIGSFEPRKNLSRIIEAFHLVKKQGYPHKLILAGKEEGKNCLPHFLIQKLGIEKEIVLKGYISEEEKKTLFQEAALLLWPTLYEGFGIPLLEAMASGTPIVTSNRAIHKEVVNDAGVFVDPEDPQAIAQGIEKILSSKEQTESLVEKGPASAKAFHIDLFRQKHLELYANLC